VSSVGDRRRALSRFGERHPRLRLGLLLTPPTLWLAVAYVGSLVALLFTSLYSIDPFTSNIVHSLTLSNFSELISTSVYRTVALRTIWVAALATVVDLLIALPMAFFMAKVARPWVRRALAVAVLMPLWASYLVKAYAWRLLLNPQGGVLHQSIGHSPGFGITGLVMVLAYLWLPYMILPVYAGFERLPNSLLEAAADMGASAGRTWRDIIVPLVKPSIVAGSIFTFSLSLGDYIAVNLAGGKTQVLGTIIYSNFGAPNVPFAATVATIPVLVMAVYLTLARRSGAFENL
jgi:putative spermidine/putrescine transport system permease protein